MGKTKKPAVETEKPKHRKDKPKKITIVNNSPRIITLTYRVGAEGKPAQAMSVPLKPGPNAVDRHIYETHLKGHETVKKYTTQKPGEKNARGRIVKGDKMILVIDESGPPATANKTVEDAVELVESVCDHELLYKMEEDESRGEVRKAIDERRAEIGPTDVAEKQD